MKSQLSSKIEANHTDRETLVPGNLFGAVIWKLAKFLKLSFLTITFWITVKSLCQVRTGSNYYASIFEGTMNPTNKIHVFFTNSSKTPSGAGSLFLRACKTTPPKLVKCDHVHWILGLHRPWHLADSSPRLPRLRQRSHTVTERRKIPPLSLCRDSCKLRQVTGLSFPSFEQTNYLDLLTYTGSWVRTSQCFSVRVCFLTNYTNLWKFLVGFL